MYDTTTLEEAAHKVASADARLASDDELFAAALGFEQAQRRLDAARSHVLAELDARGSTDIVFGLRTPTWLAREAHLPRKLSKDRVLVANALRSNLDETDEALADGRIDWQRSRVMAAAATNPRIGHQIVEMEHDLLAEAQALPFEQWARQIATIVELLDQDGAHDPNEHLARNRLHFEDGFDHATRLTGVLTEEYGLGFRQAVEARADRLFRRFSADHKRFPDIEIPTRPTLLALALVELVRESQGIDLHSTKAPNVDASLVLQAGDPTSASTPGGIRLADETTRLLCCDAFFTPVVVDNLGIPLDMGRERRLATEAQRRAAARRDGGCIIHGCDAPPSWVDMHHLNLWDEGGLTDIDVLASLCRRDHGVVHRAGWHVHATADGWFYISTPSGNTYWCQRHGRIPGGPPPPHSDG